MALAPRGGDPRSMSDWLRGPDGSALSDQLPGAPGTLSGPGSAAPA